MTPPTRSGIRRPAHRRASYRGPVGRRLVTLASFALVALCGLAPAAHAGTTIPYQDPGKVGSITLCDASGHPVTSGSVTASPFVWSLHTDVAATGGLADAGRTATYVAYQPREGLDPGDWSGRVMAPGSRYTDPQHPTVQLTSIDDGLNQMTTAYPPLWDGLLELRVYLSAPGEPSPDTQYAALTLQVSPDGKTWTALDPGNTPCNVGKAVSTATLLGLVPSGTASPSPDNAAAAVPNSKGHKVHAGTIPKNVGPTETADAATGTAAPDQNGSGSSPLGLIAALATLAVVGAFVTRWLRSPRRS